MRAEFRCEHCDYATFIAGESDDYDDDLIAFDDWCDENDAHDRACRGRVEAEAAARREAEAAPAKDDVVDYMGQASALLARAGSAEATRQPMLAATYRKAAETRMWRARVALRLRALDANRPAWSPPPWQSTAETEEYVRSIASRLRFEDAMRDAGVAAGRSAQEMATVFRAFGAALQIEAA